MVLPTVQTAKTQFVTTKDNIKLAYRYIGIETGVPLLLLQHFRATIDHWDPLLVNILSLTRPIILFDNAGIGHSTGEVDENFVAMGDHVIEFLSLINVKEVDIFGFSLGGIIAPFVKLNGPKGLVRKLILAGMGPTAGKGVEPGMADPNVQKYATVGEVQEEAETSGEERLKYLSEGLQDGGAGMMALITAMVKGGDVANRAEGSYDRLGELDGPVLVANGYEDIMVPTVNSFVMSQKIPNAFLLVYPGAGHGFCFQYPEHFAKQVVDFLDEWN
ncbi:uncharacterized protein PAC_12162 [Phialocephala subalpina]|uniref:AB hydrolase-1 domain-containing protein n=1 Tax=Phialocephala subalpina TaxID=576137 RepID=A0A1L7XB79_9HELO|nr:uncharacterized protein PAC_12162 [Phialocephala subalpina]